MLEPGRIPQQRFCRIAALSILIGGIAVGGVPISPSTAPAGAVGTAYSQLFQCDCGGGTVWSYSGSLPPGLNLQASSGLLSGTPTAGGTYSFTISVVDGDISGSQSYTVAIIEIQPGPPLANGATGISYSLSFTVLYGSGSYSWSSFNAPPGLKMSSGGVLSGIPTTVGTFVFNVNAAPVAGAGPVGPSVSATFQLTVVNPLKITSSVIMPNGVAGLNYSQVITASGGTQPYTFTLEPATIAPNVLPAGLSLNAAGLLYVHLVDHSSMGAPVVPQSVKDIFRKEFKGALILSGGYDAARAESDLEAGKADLITVGRPILANPDLVERWKTGAPLNAPDPTTFYTPGPKGYTDYPVLAKQPEPA